MNGNGIENEPIFRIYETTEGNDGSQDQLCHFHARSLHPHTRTFWRIWRSSPQYNAFYERFNIDLRIFVDVTVYGRQGIAGTAEKYSVHLIVWNAGSYPATLQCLTDTTEPSTMVLEPLARTIVSGYGEGISIDVGDNSYQVRLGRDDAEQNNRAWVRCFQYFHWQPSGWPLDVRVNDMARAPMYIRAVRGGRLDIRNPGSPGLAVTESTSQDPFRRVLKHLKMVRQDTPGECRSDKLLNLEWHLSIVPYLDWCPISRLLVRALLPNGPIQYSDFPSPNHVTLLAYDMIHALHHLHSNGIVHANVKPNNIFRVPFPNHPRPRFQLADFALSAEDDLTLRRGSPNRHGSPYLAPELRPSPRGFRIYSEIWPRNTDIWSLGLVLLQMLARSSPPSWPSSGNRLMHKRDYMAQVQRRLQSIRSQASPLLNDILEGMLRAHPPARMTARALVAMLPPRDSI